MLTPDAETPVDEVPAALARLETRIRGEQEALLEALEADLFDPLREALEHAAERHRELIEENGLDESQAADLDPHALWQRLRTYRRRVRDDVMVLLHEQLDALAPEHDLTGRWRAMYEALGILADEVPETMSRAEPDALFETEPGEGWRRRLRKAQTRAHRRLRERRRRAGNAVRHLVRRAPTPAPPFEQHIPLRHLARYHLSVRLRDALDEQHRTAHQALAAPIARLETALTAWTHQMLQVERRLDRPAYHLSEGSREMLEAAAGDPPPPGEAEGAFVDAQAQARLLDRALSEAATAADAEVVAEAVEEAQVTSWAALLQDVERAGTFMLPLERRPLPENEESSTPGDEGKAWARWHEEAVARLHLDAELLRFSTALEELQAAFVGRVMDRGITPVLEVHDEAAARLRTLHAEASDALDEPRDAVAVRATLDDLHRQAINAVEHGLLDGLRAHRQAQPMQKAADDGIRQWLDVVQTLPASLHVHPLADPDTPVKPRSTPRREVRPREAAQQALDALLLEQLRVAVVPLQEAVGRSLREAGEVPSIIRFNLNAAAEELPDDAELTDDAARDARELALNGLARPLEVVTTERNTVLQAVPPFTRTTAAAYARGWERVHERLRVEDRVQEQLIDLRTRLSTATRQLWHRTRAGADRGGTKARHLLRFGRRRAGELVRIGQTAVGTATVTEAERRQALMALADADALVRHFPLVYRRLFTFQPVADVDLLTGRQVDLDRVRDHVDQWANHLAGVLLLSGPRDGGLTSFLNVVRQSILPEVQPDAAVHTITLGERIRTEAAFAARVADELGLQSDDGAPWTLDRLVEQLSERSATASPEVILIEHLEHLFLRTVGGTHLLEDVLTFMSRTDAHLLWIGTITEHGARFVRKTEPATASIVRWHALTPLNADALEQLVMRRHRRSGLPLSFEASDDLNPLLRRRLRRAHAEEERQALLRTAYFERLHRLSGQSITLALFYWLRSADLDAESQLLRIRPVQPLRLNFLNDFDLEQAFTLKAFLDHTTLTLAEHSEIFQTTSEDSRQRFEALSNVLLIESVEDSQTDRSSIGPAIVAGHRYRLRPLTIHPVTQYLQGRHIAY